MNWLIALKSDFFPRPGIKIKTLVLKTPFLYNFFYETVRSPFGAIRHDPYLIGGVFCRKRYPKNL